MSGDPSYSRHQGYKIIREARKDSGKRNLWTELFLSHDLFWAVGWEDSLCAGYTNVLAWSVTSHYLDCRSFCDLINTFINLVPLLFKGEKYKSKANTVDIDLREPHTVSSSLSIWKKQPTKTTSEENKGVPGFQPLLWKGNLFSSFFRSHVGCFPGRCWEVNPSLNSNLAKFLGVLAVFHSSPFVSLWVTLQPFCVNWRDPHGEFLILLAILQGLFPPHCTHLFVFSLPGLRSIRIAGFSPCSTEFQAREGIPYQQIY